MTTNQRDGHFVWRELMTNDVEASKRFYSEVFGWKVKEATGMPGYTEFFAGERAVAGMMKITPEMQAPPCWIGYVAVPDVDAAAKTATASGGQVLAGPMDIPNVGRFATVMDPQGGVVSVFRFSVEEPPTSPTPNVGEFCWEQLNTTDVAAANAFYTKVVGWKVGEFQGMSTYNAGAASVASVMQAPPGVPAHWLTYVAVDSLGAARDRVKRMGGTIMVEQIAVPTVGTFAVAQDPQGATICLFEGEQQTKA